MAAVPAAVVDESKLRAVLRPVFASCDTDNSGSISVSEVQRLCQQLGMKLSTNRVRRMVAEADPDRSGTLDFEEFVTAIKKQITAGNGGALASAVQTAGNILGLFDGLVSLFGGASAPASSSAATARAATSSGYAAAPAAAAPKSKLARKSRANPTRRVLALSERSTGPRASNVHLWWQAVTGAAEPIDSMNSKEQEKTMHDLASRLRTSPNHCSQATSRIAGKRAPQTASSAQRLSNASSPPQNGASASVWKAKYNQWLVTEDNHRQGDQLSHAYCAHISAIPTVLTRACSRAPLRYEVAWRSCRRAETRRNSTSPISSNRTRLPLAQSEARARARGPLSKRTTPSSRRKHGSDSHRTCMRGRRTARPLLTGAISARRMTMLTDNRLEAAARWKCREIGLLPLSSQPTK